MRLYNVEIDLTITPDYEPLKYKQFDNGNELEIAISNNGKRVTLATETIVAYFQLADNTVIQKNCSIRNGNILVILDNNILSQDGKALVEFSILKDGSVATTSTLYMEIERSINRNEAIETIAHWDIIQSLIDVDGDGVAEFVQELIAARDGATSISSRIQRDIDNLIVPINTAESARVTAENSRKTSENARATAETNRTTEFNAIKKAYDDATKANLNLEVSNARSNSVEGKSYANLQERLDKEKQAIESQLADNMQQSLVTELPINTLSNSQDGIMQVESIKGKTLKNEIYYNPATWAEWSKDIQCPVSNGYLVLDNNNIGINIKLNTALKPNTKYGALMHTKTNTRTTPFHFIVDEAFTTRSVINAGETGDFKFIVTTNPTITFNRLYSWASTDTGKIEYGNIRLFELPTGSQIEKDFDTLTAGQLAIKYPFFLGIISTGMGSSDIKAITTDYQGKIAGSVVENPNIGKYAVQSQIQVPTSFAIEFIGTSSYDKLSSLNGVSGLISSSTNGIISQQLFSWNLIETVERKIGSIGNTVAEKVTWLKNNLSKITCNWWGYGSSPLGNKAYLARFTVGANTWGTSPKYHSLSTTSLLSYGDFIASDNIDANGFAHFLAYADASDGVTPSVINTDYVNLTLEFKAWQRPKTDLENNKIEILSTGRNLFDKDCVIKNYFTSLSGTKFNNTATEIEPGKFELISSSTSWAGIQFPIKRLNKDCNISFKAKNVLSGTNDDNKNGYSIVFLDKNEKYLKHYTILAKDDVCSMQLSKADLAMSSYISIQDGSSWSGVTTRQIWDIQIEEGTVATATAYEPYKSDKLEILLSEPLRGLPNGVADEIFYSLNKRVKRVEKYVLNGSENWKSWDGFVSGAYAGFTLDNTIPYNYSVGSNVRAISDKFKILVNGKETEENIGLRQLGDLNRVYFCIDKSKLTTPDVAGFKAWLQANPVTVFYELATPVEETLNLPSLKSFKGGTLQLNNAITPTVTVKYPSNIPSRLSGVETELDKLSTDHFNTLKALLIVADKEAKMKNVSLLATETTLDIKNKINEILTIWR